MTNQLFPKVPLLTDIQERLVREHGLCPNCTRQALAEAGCTLGLRYMGCICCQTIVVLEARPDDVPRVVLRSRRSGRVYQAQRVDVAMRMYRELEGPPVPAMVAP